MPNFPGKRLYPMLAGPTAMIDTGYVTKHLQTGFARGGTVEDYNDKLRGLGQRIDQKPERPYP